MVKLKLDKSLNYTMFFTRYITSLQSVTYIFFRTTKKRRLFLNAYVTH
jgi:hypothetical protein